jgi:predicted XRE-type DNA-binding protein
MAEQPQKNITRSIMNKPSKRKPRVKIERGSGNVFADLGLPNPEERLAKAKLASEICELIATAGLTQTQAADRLGIDQPKVSMLMRGRLKDFSTERLMLFIVRLGRDVVIGIQAPQNRRHPSMRVMAMT